MKEAKKVLDYTVPEFQGHYEVDGKTYSIRAFPDSSSTHEITNKYVEAETPYGDIAILITLTDGRWIDYYFDSHVHNKALFEVLDEQVSKKRLPVDWKEHVIEKERDGWKVIYHYLPYVDAE